MPAPFTYTSSPSRILFGAGRVSELGAELRRLGVHRALLLTTPEQAALADQATLLIGGLAGGSFSGATMHTPVGVTEAALARLQALGCDGLVALGGGSTIGLSKALALRSDLPQVAVPTTYAGSEMTPILGETHGDRKTTQRSPKVLPETVIYDVDLTLSLPPGVAAVSGMNALAHGVEALYARDANPVTSLMAEEGIGALGRSLRRVVADPNDHEARTTAQYGAWLCGTCLSAVGMALHHKVCHVLGGAFDLRHAETHTVMLPHVVAYNAQAAPDAIARLGRALGMDDAAGGVFGLARTLRAPASLRELGMPEGGIGHAVEKVLQDQYWNPRPPERGSLEAMLRRAWRGDRPQAD